MIFAVVELLNCSGALRENRRVFVDERGRMDAKVDQEGQESSTYKSCLKTSQISPTRSEVQED